MEHFPVCTHCGFTWGEYRARGLLGCPHCYAGFGEALQADLAWLHRALAFAAPVPASAPDPVPSPENLARWRESLAEAVRSEHYEEAARLKRLILGLDTEAGGKIAGGTRPGFGLV